MMFSCSNLPKQFEIAYYQGTFGEASEAPALGLAPMGAIEYSSLKIKLDFFSFC